MNPLFKVNQIICLEDCHSRLYGEVIQLIPDRGTCWFRPICMAVGELSVDCSVQNKRLVRLDSSSDLLWPTSLFRPAWDVEVISLLSQGQYSDNLEAKLSSHEYFNQFVRQVWENNRDKF